MDLKEKNEGRSKEKELRLKELELEYELAKSGLKYGLIFFPIALVALIVGPLFKGKAGLISGDVIIWMVGFAVVGFVFYFSFVFRRITKIKANISEEKKQLEIEIEAGENISR